MRKVSMATRTELVEAICEAVTRPTMRFVGIKSPEQQSAMMLHRVRLIRSRQRTQLSNSLRAHLAEFGIVAPIGRNGIDRLLGIIAAEWIFLARQTNAQVRE